MNQLKKTFSVIFAVLTSLSTYADVIVLNDGSSLQVHNVEAATKWVYYTDSADSDDVKRIAIDKVFAYKIGDGQMTVVGSQDKAAETAAAPAPQEAATDAPRQVEPRPAADNATLIAAYNNVAPLKYKGKEPDYGKNSDYFLSLWGIEENSVLSDDNVEIGFEKVYMDNDKNHSVLGTRIRVRNKTAKPVYIDLASCYRIMNGGYAVPYFTNSVYNEGQGSSKGGSMNLGAVAGALGVGGVVGTLAGGINVGGSNSHSANISTAEQQILNVPPFSSVTLPGMKVTDGANIHECLEPFHLCNEKAFQSSLSSIGKNAYIVQRTLEADQKMQRVPDDPNATGEKLAICRWGEKSFTPQDSPKHIGRIITYSTSPDFATYTSLPVNLYMRGAFGIKPIWKDQIFYNDKHFEPSADAEYLIIGYGSIRKK